KNQDNIDSGSDEFVGERRHAVHLTVGPQKFEIDIASLLPAERTHIAPKRLGKSFVDALWIRAQHADDGQLARLLRGCCVRPSYGCRPSNHFDKITSSHWLLPMHGTSPTGLRHYQSKAGNARPRNGVERSFCVARRPARSVSAFGGRPVRAAPDDP